MNNILISGVPRSGKTTLAMMLAKELPNYHIISLDCLRNSFDDIFPELNINPRGGENCFVDFPRFISRVLYWNKKDLKGQFNYIIEGTQILPDIAKELFNDCEIIYLGHGDLNSDEILSNIRKYDTPDTYSYKRNDATMLKSIEKHRNIDYDIQEKCKSYAFKYIDTSFNRMQKLKALVSEIKNTNIKQDKKK